MASIISTVSGILSIVSFAQSWFPTSNNYGTYVRVGVGLNGPKSETSNPLSGANGNYPRIETWDSTNAKIGSNDLDIYTKRAYIDSGKFVDKYVTGDGRQAAFLEIHGGNDAICIAYILATWADGSNWGFTGDMFQVCGQPWYYSGMYATAPDKPLKCGWLDADHTNGLNVGRFKFLAPAFKTTSASGKSASTLCSWPNLEFSYESRFYEPWGYEWKRDLNGNDTPTQPEFVKDTRLVVSKSLSAIELCNSTSSLGPDFVSIAESVFCDMTAKSVYPLCSVEITNECFDHEENVLVKGLTKRQDNTTTSDPVVLYDEVLLWD